MINGVIFNKLQTMDRHLGELKSVWKARPDIIAVWLFGSVQQEEARKGADIDLGILFQGKQ